MHGGSFPPVYLPWSPFSMTPSQIQHVTSLVFTRDMDSVIEIGAGVSTPCIYWAMLHLPWIERRVLRSVEWDKTWAALAGSLVSEVTRQDGQTRQFGAGARHRVRWECFTRSGSAVADCLEEGRKPQLIVIDGPCASKAPNVRLCNVELVRTLRAPGTLVFIHDTNRPGEQTLLRELCDAPHVIDTHKEEYAIIEYTD